MRLPPDEISTLDRMLDGRAEMEPERVAARFHGRSWSFAELRDRAWAMAVELALCGVKPGDGVAVVMPRSVDALVACFAILRAGGVVLGLDVAAPKARNKTLIQRAGVRWSVTGGSAAAESVDETTIIAMPSGETRQTSFASRAEPEKDAFLVFTSGSSGEPKGVRLSHAAMVARSGTELAVWNMDAGDRYLMRTPLSIVGLPVLLAILAGGVTLVIADQEDGNRATELARLIEEERITRASFPPRILRDFLVVPDSARKLQTLRMARSAGDSLDRAVVSRIGEILPACRIVDGYGLTESSGIIMHDGWPFFGVETRIEREELWIATPLLATAYLDGDRDTESKFIRRTFADDSERLWYRTGDRAQRRADGQISVLGRVDLQLNVDGVRIDPLEIEAALRLHPFVADAAVAVHTDATDRSRLVAYVVEEPDNVPAPNLRAFLSDRVPLSMVPARFLRLKALPLNTSRKLDRAALPKPPAFDRILTEPSTPLERILLELFKTTLQLETAGIDDDFFECGGDSLGAFSLVNRIAEITGTTVPASILLEAPTVKRLAAAVEGQGRDSIAISWLNGAGPPTRRLVGCIPGVVGDPMVFSPIASFLKEDFGLLGVSLVGLKAPFQGARVVDEVMVRLRAAQPDGPYRLLGYSIGGILAFHLASRLLESGQRVSFLGMIDTYLPGQPRSAPTSPAEIAAHAARRARNHTRARERSEPAPKTGLAEAMGGLPLVPSPLAITLFRAQESRIIDPAHGWAALAERGVQIVTIPGRHTDVMDPEHAPVLAERVRHALSER